MKVAEIFVCVCVENSSRKSCLQINKLAIQAAWVSLRDWIERRLSNLSSCD